MSPLRGFYFVVMINYFFTFTMSPLLGFYLSVLILTMLLKSPPFNFYNVTTSWFLLAGVNTYNAFKIPPLSTFIMSPLRGFYLPVLILTMLLKSPPFNLSMPEID
jgi:hypothetical protein